MTETKAIWALVQRLKELTEAGKLPWEKKFVSGVYQVSLARYSIDLLSQPGQNEFSAAPDYVIKVYDDSGDVISEKTDVEISKELSISSPEVYNAMKELYAEARSKALNVNESLADLLRTLDNLSD